MKHLRRYIRQILLEGTEEPDLTRYVDDLEALIIDFILAPITVKELQSLSTSEETTITLDTGKLFANYENVNEVQLTLSVNDQNSAAVDAAYACDTVNRAQSNLILMVDLPRQYDQIPELRDWISAELADALSHELQHSCDPTEMLGDDIPEGEAKWESLESIEKYYASDAETRGHVAGIRGRSRRTGKDPNELLELDKETILYKALDRGYTELEMKPVMTKIHNKWLARLEELS